MFGRFVVGVSDGNVWHSAVMSAELSSVLAVEHCGLDPLFNSSLKLYICDVLNMPEHDSHTGSLHLFISVMYVEIYSYCSCSILNIISSISNCNSSLISV